MIQTKPLLLSCAVALVLAQSAYADNNTNLNDAQPRFTLDPLAARLVVSTNVQVIDNQQLKASATQNIDDIALYEPGVDVRSDNMQLGHQNFNIRGIDGNRILMTIDGIPLPDEQGDIGPPGPNGIIKLVAGRDTVETDTLRSVRIIKGGNGTAQGDGAVGGSVNMQTYNPSDLVDDDKPMHFGLKYSHRGAYNSHGLTASAVAKQGIYSGLVMATKRRLKNHENYPAEGSAEKGELRTQSNQQDTEQNNLLVKFHIHGDNHSLENTIERFTRKVATERFDLQGNTRSRRGNPLERPIAKATDDYKRIRYGINYRYTPDGGFFDEATVRLYAQNLDVLNTSDSTSIAHNATASITQSIDDDNTYTQRLKGIRPELQKTMVFGNATHHLLFGSEYRQTKTARLLHQFVERTGRANAENIGAYFPPADRKVFSLYTQDNITFANNATMGIGLRYEREKTTFDFNNPAYLVTVRNNPVAFKDFSNGILLPSLGFSYPLTNNLTGSILYRRGYRSPDVNFVASGYEGGAGTVRYRVKPNPNLKPESSDNYEFSLNYQNDNLSASVTTFYHRYKDFINSVTKTTDLTPGYNFEIHFDNLSKATTRGVEAKAGYHISENLVATGSVAWIDTKNASNNQPLSTAYPINGVLGLTYTQDNWDVGAKLRMAAKNKKTPTSTIATPYFQSPGYAVLDLVGNYKLNKHLSFGAGVYNVADKKYWLSADTKGVFDNAQKDRYTQPGRNFAFSAEFTF